MFAQLINRLFRRNSGQPAQRVTGYDLQISLPVSTTQEPPFNRMVARNIVERNGRGKNGKQGKVTYRSTGAMNIDFYSASDVNIGDLHSIVVSLQKAYKASIKMERSVDDGHNTLVLIASRGEWPVARLTLLKSNTTVAGGSDSFIRKSGRLARAFRRLDV